MNQYFVYEPVFLEVVQQSNDALLQTRFTLGELVGCLNKERFQFNLLWGEPVFL